MKVISIVNQKGGVGKTTTVINLATALASVDQRILVIDFDPQGNSSTGFGIDRPTRVKDIYSVICDQADINEAVVSSNVPNLYVITATRELAAADVELANEENSHAILANKIARLKSAYDFIIIDCPPSLGMLTINALSASNSVLIPVQCEYFSLEGLTDFQNTFNIVKNNLNNKLVIEGLLLTMYDRRNNLHSQIENSVREYYGSAVYDTVIPRNVRISEAPSHGKPVIIYDIHSKGATAYIELASEVIRRNNIEAF